LRIIAFVPRASSLNARSLVAASALPRSGRPDRRCFAGHFRGKEKEKRLLSAMCSSFTRARVIELICELFRDHGRAHAQARPVKVAVRVAFFIARRRRFHLNTSGLFTTAVKHIRKCIY